MGEYVGGGEGVGEGDGGCVSVCDYLTSFISVVFIFVYWRGGGEQGLMYKKKKTDPP